MSQARPEPSALSRERGQPAAAIDRRNLLAAGVAGLVTTSIGTTEGGFLQHRSAARARRSSRMTEDKARAILNYETSLARFGGRLSNPIGQLLGFRRRQVPHDIDIAIIGSGYGGGITAARLAQQKGPGVRLCVLERGKEWVPGTFADSLRTGAQQTRNRVLGHAKGEVARPGGLLNFSQGGDLSVLTGSGLGGTSLINANVAIRPDAEVFQQSQWPLALRYPEVLDPFFDAACFELGVNRGPLDSSPKMVAQRRAAARLAVADKHHFAANLSVTFDARFASAQQPSPHGMLQAPCTLCGDCMSGCNVGAKNTVQMNYLPLAKRYGAEIYTQVECNFIEKLDHGYRLHLIGHAETPQGTELFRFTKTARVVVMAGGSLGSTAVLMRSQAGSLVFSPALGSHFSGNGDALGFIVNSQEFTHDAGVGTYPYDGPPVGPSIQTITRLYGHGPLHRRILIQDGNMPRAFANLIGMVMRDVDFDHTLALFAMGHDGNQGKIVLHKGQPIVEWPGHKDGAYRQYVIRHFHKMGEAHGGRYKMLRLFGNKGISAHPMGGCNMSDDPLYGVVNDRGQVYDGACNGYHHPGSDEAAVHAGLYIADGSVLSTSLGANPFLTIAAISERISAAIAMDGRHQDLFMRIERPRDH